MLILYGIYRLINRNLTLSKHKWQLVNFLLLDCTNFYWYKRAFCCVPRAQPGKDKGAKLPF